MRNWIINDGLAFRSSDRAAMQCAVTRIQTYTGYIPWQRRGDNAHIAKVANRIAETLRTEQVVSLPNWVSDIIINDDTITITGKSGIRLELPTPDFSNDSLPCGDDGDAREIIAAIKSII